MQLGMIGLGRMGASDRRGTGPTAMKALVRLRGEAPAGEHRVERTDAGMHVNRRVTLDDTIAMADVGRRHSIGVGVWREA